MLKVKLSEVKPEIIPALMMALRPELDYLPAASYCLPVLFKDGRIPAYPPDCEILATIMARVLIVSQSTTSTIGDTMFRHPAGAARGLSKKDVMFPGQSFSNDPSSPMRPRRNFFSHADLQHRDKITPEQIRESHLSNVRALEPVKNQKMLQFDLNNGESIKLVTQLSRKNFPFPHSYEPNGDRSQVPHFWSIIEPNHDERKVIVTFSDGIRCTYTYLPSDYHLYCGDMIDYINKHSLHKGVRIVRIHELDYNIETRRVPYISCETDQDSQSDGQFQVKTAKSYKELAQTGAGNASSSIYSLIL